MSTLLQLSSEILALEQALQDHEEHPETQEQLINQFLETQDKIEEKLDNYSALISELEARAAVRKAEAKRLAELAAKDEKRVEMLKERLKWFFTVNNLKKIETTRYQLSLVKSGGKPPLIIDESVKPTDLPEKFQKISIEPDKTAIREALDAGEELDFAHLGDRSSSLRIR